MNNIELENRYKIIKIKNEVSSIIDSSRNFDGQYVYICNLIQWEDKYAM